jgi:hypothetical protein
LSRTDCADMPEPATSKILNEGMSVLRYARWLLRGGLIDL